MLRQINSNGTEYMEFNVSVFMAFFDRKALLCFIYQVNRDGNK